MEWKSCRWLSNKKSSCVKHMIGTAQMFCIDMYLWPYQRFFLYQDTWTLTHSLSSHWQAVVWGQVGHCEVFHSKTANLHHNKLSHFRKKYFYHGVFWITDRPQMVSTDANSPLAWYRYPICPNVYCISSNLAYLKEKYFMLPLSSLTLLLQHYLYYNIITPNDFRAPFTKESRFGCSSDSPQKEQPSPLLTQ